MYPSCDTFSSLGVLDDAVKRSTVGRSHMIMYETDLKFKRRFEAYVYRADRIKPREKHFTRTISFIDIRSRHQARVALICPEEKTCTTADIDLMLSCYNHNYAHLSLKMTRLLGVSLSSTLPPCKGCSLFKAQHRSVARHTTSRATKQLRRAFANLR